MWRIEKLHSVKMPQCDKRCAIFEVTFLLGQTCVWVGSVNKQRLHSFEWLLLVLVWILLWADHERSVTKEASVFQTDQASLRVWRSSPSMLGQIMTCKTVETDRRLTIIFHKDLFTALYAIYIWPKSNRGSLFFLIFAPFSLLLSCHLTESFFLTPLHYIFRQHLCLAEI